MDFQEMFFSFDGRLNRKPYILRFLLRNAIIWCLGYLIGSLFAPDGTMFQILAFALTFIAALSCLSLYVRRLHDLDHGSLMVLLAFIPLIIFFYAVFPAAILRARLLILSVSLSSLPSMRTSRYHDRTIGKP